MPSHAYGIKLEARHKVKKGTSSPPCNIPRLSIPEFCSRSHTSLGCLLIYFVAVAWRVLLFLREGLTILSWMALCS